MTHWLLKTEPDAYSWADQVKKKVEPWTGVRNAQARNFMRAMKKGELVFFYHTGEERQIVGIVVVARIFYPDAEDKTGRWGQVDVRTVKPLPKPVTLSQIKAEPKLGDLLLVRHSRLSVMPIEDKAWTLISKMGGL